jgi:nuclear distribution NudE-like protein 1
MSTTNTFHCFITIIHSIQESSRELEAELETQIKQAEHQVRELRSNNHRLLIEHNSLKVII